MDDFITAAHHPRYAESHKRLRDAQARLEVAAECSALIDTLAFGSDIDVAAAGTKIAAMGWSGLTGETRLAGLLDRFHETWLKLDDLAPLDRIAAQRLLGRGILIPKPDDKAQASMAADVAFEWQRPARPGIIGRFEVRRRDLSWLAGLLLREVTQHPKATIPIAAAPTPQKPKSGRPTAEAKRRYDFALPHRMKGVSWKTITDLYKKESGEDVDETAFKVSFHKTRRKLCK